MRHYWHQWLRGGKRQTLAWVVLLAIILGVYISILLPHIHAITNFNGTAEGGNWKTLAKGVEDYWNEPKEFGTIQESANSILRFLFHITPNEMGYKPLFTAFLGYTRFILDSIYAIERPDIFLNLFLLLVNSILIFVILKRGIGAPSAFMGGLFYGFSPGPLTVAMGGYSEIIGMTFILLAAYMLITIDYTKLQRRRLLLAGLFLASAIFASTQTVPVVIGLVLFLVARLVLTSARVYRVPSLLRKVSFTALGLALPLLYYAARDIWLYYNYHYPDGGQHGPYVFRDILTIFTASLHSIEDFLPSFYFNYMQVLGGPILLALSVILSIFGLYKLVRLVQNIRAGKASLLDPENQSQVLFLALAMGGVTFLLMTLMRMPALGRAYSVMTIYEALLFGLLISQMCSFRFRTRALSSITAFVLPSLLISIPLLAVGVHVKSAEDYTHNLQARYSDIPNWDVTATVRREGEFSLASFLRYLRDDTGEKQNDYFILRPPANYHYYGSNNFLEHPMLSYLAYLIGKGELEPLASIKAWPAIRAFLTEFWYYNIYLGNAPNVFPDQPWIGIIPLENETIFRTADIRKAYAKVGYLVAWDSGELRSQVGWRELFDPDDAVTTRLHPGQVISKAWEFNGGGGLSLPHGATADYKYAIDEVHGIDITGELSLGFWLKLPLIEPSTGYPIVTFGAPGVGSTLPMTEPAGGPLSVAIYDSKVVVSQGKTTLATSSLPIHKGTWTFVVVTKSRSGVKIWVNGEPAGIFSPIRKPLGLRGLAIGYDPTGRFPPLPAGTEIAQVFYSDSILSQISDEDVKKMYMSPVDKIPELLLTDIGPKLKAAPPPEIHAIWHMDEAAGAELTDASGVYGATAFNTEVVDGEFGKARRFNGQDSFMQTSLDLGGSTDVTISFWVRVDADQSAPGNVTILDNGHTATENFVVQSTDRTAKTFSWHVSGVNAPFYLPHDKWTHVLVIADSNREKLEVYVNGEKSGEAKFVRGQRFGSAPLTFGRLADWPLRFFKGDIDEVEVWNRALTKEEFPAEIRPIPQINLASYVQVPLEGSSIELSDSNGPVDEQTLVDGDAETHWHVKYPPQTDEHWAVIDLGASGTIDALRVKARRGVVSQFWDGANAVFQGSHDKKTWTHLGALAVDKSSLNNEDPQWLSFSIKSGAAFRYYRIFIKDSSFLSLAELELYRSRIQVTPVEVPPVKGAPKTYQGLVQVPLESSSIEVSSFNNPEWENKRSLVDSNLETFWHVKWPPQSDEHWVLIDLGTQGTIDMLRVKARRGYPSHFWDEANAVFQGSNDKEIWNSLETLTVDKSTLNKEEPQWLDFSIKGKGAFRYYRIFIKDSSFLSIAELEIYRSPQLVPGEKVGGSDLPQS